VNEDLYSVAFSWTKMCMMIDDGVKFSRQMQLCK